MESKKFETIIIIPAFNEAKVIARVLSDIRRSGRYTCLVVDDGSFDRTYDVAKRQGALVIRHMINRGKGAAIKTGIEAAKHLGVNIIITFDGDGQHDPKDLKLLLNKVSEGYDVVLGSRFMHRQEIPLMKRIGNTIANVVTFLVYGIWVTDSQSGLRAYTKRAFEVIDTQSDRYEFESEALREIKRHHLKYVEIPMHVRYTTYSQKKENRQHIWSAMMTMIRIVLSG